MLLRRRELSFTEKHNKREQSRTKFLCLFKSFPKMASSKMAFYASLAIWLCLLTLNNAAPFPSNIPMCSTECPLTSERLFHYQTKTTYSYLYSGKSQVFLKDVEGGLSESEWSAQVDFTWISPCDVAITFKDTKLDGKEGVAEARFLERYPMVVALSDGRVQHVCNHPDDDTWAINWKKGLASIFQNSLPSKSDISSGLEFVEADVVGKCPTKYEVQRTVNAMTVKKLKDHRHCEHRYPTPFETPAAWLKAPFPIDYSKTECKQELLNGIYNSILCEDKSIIRSSYGAYKYVETLQKSTLHFKGILDVTPDAVFNLHGTLVKTNLFYDYKTPKKDPTIQSQLDETLREVCTKIQNGIEEDTAPLLAKTLKMLRGIPGNSLENVLAYIRRGQICSEYKKLESLFLDLIAFIHEPGAVRIMVNEILNEKAYYGRTTLYATALYLTPKPDIHAIDALRPLFIHPLANSAVKLAAGSMINTYCRQNPHCENETPIKRIEESIAQNVQQKSQNSPSGDMEQDMIVLLKALGNSGIMTREIAITLIMCIRTNEFHNSIRIAAAQAFRNAKCITHVNKQLVDIATDQDINTEVRIASYLAAIRCVDKEDLHEIISKITKEENTQVRGFILSHLSDLQESTTPRKQNLRYLLTDVVLPINFNSDFRRYSRNIDTSYYLDPFGIGAEYESNIIFAPGSYIPHSVNFNLSTALGGIPINLGEIGVASEGLESIIKELFGPNGHFQKSSFANILNNMKTFFEGKLKSIRSKIETGNKQTSVDSSAIGQFLKKIYGGDRSKKPRADVYARFGSQEVAYGSWSGEQLNLDIDRLVESLLKSFYEALNHLSDVNIDTARTIQIGFDYNLPTIHGIPLKLQVEGTNILGLKLVNQQVRTDTTDSAKLIEIFPGLSSQVNAYVGFDSHLLKTGVKMENLISSNTGLSIGLNVRNQNDVKMEIKLSNRLDLLNIKSETYLMKAMIGHQPTKIIPSSVKNVRIQDTLCMSSMEGALGLQLCYDVNFPNVFLSQGLPLGDPTVLKFFVKKTDTSMTSYVLKGLLQDSDGGKVFKIGFEAPGSSSPRSAESTILYKKGGSNDVLSALIESQTLHSSLWTNLIQQDRYKALEIFVKWNSNAIQFVGGIKMELKTRWTASEKGIEFNMYNSASRQFTPESKILDIKYTEKKNDQQINLDTSIRTLSNLRRLIDISFEAGVDLQYSQRLGVFVPGEIRKFELQSNNGNVIVTSYIRKMGSSRYASVFKVTNMNIILVDMRATHLTEGTIREDMHIKTQAEGNLLGTTYKYAQELAYTTSKVGATIEAIRPIDNMKIFDIEAMYSHSPEIYNTKFIVDIPEYMRAIKMESKMTKQGPKYLLESAIKHGSLLVLQVDGPIRASSSLQLVEFEADIRITPLIGGPVYLSTAVSSTTKNQALKLVIRNQHELFMSFDWLFKVENTQMWTIKYNLNTPDFTNINTEIQVMNKGVQYNANVQVFPKNPSPRRIKMVGGVDFASKEATVDLAWDVDRDPMKKITFKMQSENIPSINDELKTRGSAIYQGKTYAFVFDVLGFDEHPWKREISFIVNMPSGKTVKVLTGLMIERELSFNKFVCNVAYTNIQGHTYRYTKTLIVKDFNVQDRFHIISQTRYEAPGNQVITLHTEAKYIDIPSERIASIKSKLSTPLFQSPLEVDFRMDNKIDIYNTLFTANIGQPLTIYKYEILHHPTMGLQKFIIDLDMAAAVKLLKTVHSLFEAHVRNSIYAPVEVLQPHNYHLKYDRLNSQVHRLVVKTPSRSMEGEVEYSLDAYKMKFYPNKEKNSAKYEIETISIKSGKTSGIQEVEWHSRISHPNLTRDIKTSLQYRKEGTELKGTVVIDIFQNENDIITGTMVSTRLTDNSISIEASLSSKVLKTNPVISLTAAYAPHVISFDTKYKKSPTSEESILLAGKIDRSLGSEAALSFTYEQDRKSIIEVSGSVIPKKGPQCSGQGIQAKVYAFPIGKYHLNSNICRPSFIEISMNKDEQNDIFIARIGYRDQREAEVSLSVENKNTLQRLPILMTKISLASPNVVNIDLAKDDDLINKVKNIAKEEVEMIIPVLPSWLKEMLSHIMEEREALSQASQFPSSQFIKLLAEIKKEIKEIQRDLIQDIHDNPAWVTLKPYFLSALPLLKEFEINMRDLRARMDKFFQDNLQNFADSLLDDAIKIMRMIEDKQVPAVVQWIMNGLKQIPIVQRIQHMIEDLIDRNPDDLAGFIQIIDKIISKIEDDLDGIREDLSKIPEVQRWFNWILSNYNQVLGLQMDKFIARILNDLLVVSVKTEENHLRISIPSYRSIYSLDQAIQFTLPKLSSLIDGLIWMFYSFEPYPVDEILWANRMFNVQTVKDFLPPYNRTAIILEGKEILTFDGTILRMPLSTCKVLMTHFEDYSLYMEHPHSTDPVQLTLKTPGVLVVVKPNNQITINGREVRTDKIIKGDVQITKVPGEITLSTPFITTHVYTKAHVVSVEALGWTFGEIAGLLGTYDGEVANDWLMPDGNKASSLQQLVNSWQVDQKCITPSISPVNSSNIPELRIFQCHALLDAHNQCASTIHPSPFIKMCYVARDVSNAKWAHQAMCATKGINMPLFPPCLG